MSQQQATPLAAGKLLDFFRFFDPQRAQHVEGVRRLEQALRDQAPQLLTDQAYWVQGWRTAPAAPAAPPANSADIRARIRLQAQSNGVSCGQCSVAMAIQALTGKYLTDAGIDARYGFSLLQALQSECPGHRWRDAGDLHPGLWPDILASLLAGCPAVIGLNGPRFSPSGRGHIVLICGLVGNDVHYADPATGRFDTCLRSQMETCRPHPDGKFVFLATPR